MLTLGPGCCKPRSIPRAGALDRGHIGEAFDHPLPRDRRRGPVERKGEGAERLRSVQLCADAIAEHVGSHTLLTQALEIDIGGQQSRPGGKTLALAEVVAILEDRRLPIPGEVGRRFPGPAAE